MPLTLALAFLAAPAAGQQPPSGSDDDRAGLAALRAALEADRRNPDILVRLGERYLALGYFSEALYIAKRLEELRTPQAAVAADLIAARALVGLRRPDEALARLAGLKLPAAGKAAYEAALIEGDAWLLKRDFAKATAAYTRAKAKADDPRQADLALARVALALGDLDECRERIAPYLQDASPDPQALVLAAEIAKREGRLEDALALVSRALGLAPEDVPAHILRAGLLLALGRLEEAGADVAAVRDRLPDAPIADFLEALYLIRQGKLAQASRLAEKAAQALPRYVPLLRLRAWLAFLDGRLEEAILLAGQVEAADPKDIVASELKAAALLRRGSAREAARILERLDRTGVIDDRGRILLAGAYMRLGRYQPALHLYERAMARFEKLPELKTQYALAQFALGEVEAARKKLQELARSGAQDAFRAAVLLTLIERRLGRLEAAMKAAEEVDALSPRSPIGPNLKGLVALTAGDLAAARGFFAEALARAPDFLPARRNLARVLMRMGEEEKAREEFARVLAADPKDAIALVALAEIAARAGDTAEAERRLEAAIALQPKEPALRLKLIALKEEGGDLEAAFKAAVAADLVLPGREELVEAVARLALATGRPGIAERNYRRLAGADPAEPRYLIGLARARLARGDPKGARAILLRADHLISDPAAPIRRVLLQSLIEIDGSLGETASALGYARALMRLFPDTPGVALTRARLEAAAGDPETALALARKAHTAHPDDPQAALLLAALLLATNRESEKEQALALYRELVDRLSDPAMLAEIAGQVLDHDAALAAQAAEKALAAAPRSADLRLLAARAYWSRAQESRDPQALARARALIADLAGAHLSPQDRAAYEKLQAALAAAPS